MSLPGPAPRGVVVTAPVGGLPSPALAQDQFEGQVEWAVAHPAKSSEQSVCVCAGGNQLMVRILQSMSV